MKISKESQLVFVIPAFNEEATIANVVGQLKDKASIIVVDDGSSDQTSTKARSAGALVISHKNNFGYDKSLETGLCEAINLGYTYAITMDADGQHNPLQVDYFYESLISGADVVVGHRNEMQRWSEELFGFVGKFIWGIKDPLCGMKAYRLSKLKGLKKLNSYRSIGTEIVIRLASYGAVIVQIDVSTNQRSGQSRFGGGIEANFRIIKALLQGILLHRVRLNNKIEV
jgi:glycosyltransferase involved in cell wall biosynthesis